jgi:nitroreductase
VVERLVIESILDLARWAPSGDNTQNWRFEITPSAGLVVHGFDTREHCVYDLDGHPSQISLGALIETIAVAASTHGLRIQVSRRESMDETRPTFDVGLIADAGVRADPLAAQIKLRSVQRRAMSTRPLADAQRQALGQAVAPAYRLVWFESFAERWRVARLMFANAHLRLTMPEAYSVHRDIIEWGARFSPSKVPDQALGADAATLRLMRWVMADWERVAFFNRWLGGTLMPRLQMDLWPGLRCAAHFALLAARPPQSTDDYVAVGRAVQRLWLTASALGLCLQPELTPLIFARYVREGRSFSRIGAMHRQAADLALRLAQLLGDAETPDAAFMGRIGAGTRSGRCNG